MGNGGWYSFGGEHGYGGWARSRLHPALPVVCRDGDDLIESTAGYDISVGVGTHKVARVVPWETAPPILGFNETSLRPGATAILEIDDRGTKYPLLAHQRYGRGNVTAFTTTP